MSVTVHHRLEGPADAPVLVLAGSLGTTLEMWDDLVPDLLGRFRVLRYDHRGHGGSPVPPGPYEIADLGGDLLGLLDRLGIERVSLCGLSLGGLVGMWTAATAPERIDGLALCCTSARFGKREYWLERAAIARTRGMSAVAEIVLPRWFTAGFESRRPDAFARFASTLLAIPPEGYAGCCEAIADADLRGSLGAIRAPTLVIAGAEDPSLPPADAELIQSGIAGARLTVLPGAAHLAAAERPEAVARAVLDHLAAATTAQER